MKRISILLFLFTLCKFSFGNLLDSTATWYTFSVGTWVGNVSYYYRTYFFDGDTTIGGVTYYKQYFITVDSSIQNVPPGPTTVTTSGPYFNYALRENTNKEFWAVHEFSTGEVLKEDFSLVVGDTTLGGCVVNSIDSFYFNGGYRKKFIASYPGYAYVEGIGETKPCGLIMEGSLQLCAFVMGADTFTVDSGCLSNQYAAPQKSVTGISSVQNDNSFYLYPNPAINSLDVSCKEPAKVEVYDVHGAICCSIVIATGNTKIDISGLKAGVYFCNLRTNSGTQLRRTFIKT